MPGRIPTAKLITALRDSLTVLAILLIGILTAALVGPYVVDWNGQRSLIERRLTQAAGAPVTVAGPIDVKLLPTPRLRFGDVTIGDAKAGRPRLTAKALEAEISLTALMRGQVQIVDTTLVSPRLDLEQAADGTIDLALPTDSTADSVAVDHLGVRDGTVVIRLADGRPLTLANLDVDGEATSLRGPFKIGGRLAGVQFRVATGTLDQGHMRVKLHVDGSASRPALDSDGMLARHPGAVGPGFDGTATLAGSLPIDGSPATIPWSLAMRVSVDRNVATASDVELRAGTDMRALIARGEGTGSFAASASPTVALHLHGASLDLDGLAVAPADGSIAPPKGVDLAPSLLRALGLADGAGGGSLPLRLDLGLGFDTATIGGRTLIGTEAVVGLGREPTAALTLSAEGPQGARLSLDGRVDPGPVRAVAGAFGAAPAAPAAMFRGRTEIRLSDIGRTAAWLAPLAPDVASALAGLPGRSLRFAAAVEASSTGVVARDVALDLDGSRFAGLLSFTRSVGTDRARLFADLTSDALALDHLPDPSSAATATRDLDLDLALTSRAVTLADPVVSFPAGHPGPLAAGHLALHLTKTGDDLHLRRLAFDVDGGLVEGSAERTGFAAKAEFHISVPQLGPLSQAFGGLVPLSAGALLRDRASALSPLDATLSTEATVSGGALAPTRLSLVGTAGGTHVDLTLTPVASAASIAGGAQDRPLAVTLKAEASDGADLLTQLAIPVSGAHWGTARLDAEGQGSLAAGFDMTASGTAGASMLAFKGHAGTAEGAGRLTLASPDIGPAIAGVVGGGVGSGIRTDVATDVAWTGSHIDFKGIVARIADTQGTGSLGLDLQPKRDAAGAPLPVLTGAMSIDRLPASLLVDLGFGPPSRPATSGPWSTGSFVAPSVPLPASHLSVKAATMPLFNGLQAQDVGFDLLTRGRAVTLSNVAGKLARGQIGGAVTLRHDASGNTLSGQLTWADIGLDVGGLSGRTSGMQEFSGTGNNPAALMASLAGPGSVALHAVALAQTDPTALAQTMAATAVRDIAAERASGGTDVTPTDANVLLQMLSAQLDAAPLRLGDGSVPTTLVGGVWRVGPLTVSGTAPPVAQRQSVGIVPAMPWSVGTTATLDLGALTLATRADLHAAPAGEVGDGPEAVVTRVGPIGSVPFRSVDAAGLVAAVQARAIARAQDRIDVVEQDIRERAAFNRQLKALQAEQQAAKDRAEVERQAAVAQAAADARARADAMRAVVDAQRAAAARQKAEDARIQAQIETAARANAAAADAAEKQRFIDKALKASDPPLDTGGSAAPLRAPERRSSRPGDTDLSDPSASSIIR
ncbi:MAG: AsmA family protein [Janthinobacterium lividum]